MEASTARKLEVRRTRSLHKLVSTESLCRKITKLFARENKRFCLRILKCVYPWPELDRLVLHDCVLKSKQNVNKFLLLGDFKYSLKGDLATPMLGRRSLELSVSSLCGSSMMASSSTS